MTRTAMLASVRGIGDHPRFLLHDSPREGDLDRMLYEGFLAAPHLIQTAQWELTNWSEQIHQPKERATT